jgi:hypothetical protein
MIEKDKILVVKSPNEVVISYMGKKLIQPIDKFINMDKDQIKDWYLLEMGGE